MTTTDTAPADTAPADADAAAMPCPRCGYDLRATTSNQCSECGFTFDPAKLAVSALPWVHRATIGRFKAFRQTCSVIAWDRKRIRHELSRPHDVADARRYSVVIGLFLGLLLAASVLAFPLRSEAIKDFLQPPFSNRYYDDSVSQTRRAIVSDLLNPWAVGLGVPVLIPVYFLIFGYCAVRVGIAPARRVKREGPRHTAAVESMARYAAAPLWWWGYAAILFAIAMGCRIVVKKLQFVKGNADVIFMATLTASLFCAAILCAASVWLSLHRGAQWYARARRGGFFTYLIGLGELTARALGATLLGLWLIPWCVGLLLLILDYSRH